MKRKFGQIMAIVLALVLAVPWTAFADTVTVDIVPVAGVQNSATLELPPNADFSVGISVWIASSSANMTAAYPVSGSVTTTGGALSKTGWSIGVVGGTDTVYLTGKAPATANTQVTYEVLFTCTEATGCKGQANGHKSASATVTIKAVAPPKLDQVVKFEEGTRISAVYGESFSVVATASSGLAVTYASSGPCSVNSTTGVVTANGVGTCTITATQAGNDSYHSATASHSIAIGKATQIVSFSSESATSATYGDAPFTVSAEATSGGAITYSANGPCTVNSTSGVVTITGAGTCVITATQAGGDNYNLASNTHSITIAKADQTVTFEADMINSVTYGDAPFTVSAQATSGGAVTYSAEGSCSVNATSGVVTIIGAGTCVITATQAGSDNYNSASNTHSITIAKADQTVTFEADLINSATYGDAPFTVNATATSGGAVTYSAEGSCSVNAASGVVTITGAGTCVITAAQSGNDNYNAASETHTITIAKAGQSITFSSLADKKYGEAAFALVAEASSKLPVTYTASGPCKVDGNMVSLTGIGYCTITASQPGNANYNAADDVEQKFFVGLASVLWKDNLRDRQFKINRTIPVKVSTDVGQLPAGYSLKLLTKLDQAANFVAADDSGNANPDSMFRWDAAESAYVFNLSTKNWQTGSYSFQVELYYNGGKVQTITVERVLVGR